MIMEIFIRIKIYCNILIKKKEKKYKTNKYAKGNLNNILINK